MSRLRFWASPLIGLVLLVFFCSQNRVLPLLKILFPNTNEWLFDRASLGVLTLQHLGLSVAAAGIASLLGCTLGIVATRDFGRVFLPVIRDASALAQTIPPVAVLALAIPLLGFGYIPVLLALILYSILPVLNNTIAALENLPESILEAARSMGMTPLQVLFRIELPMGMPLIGTGIRTSVVINIGTATIGALSGIGGLGSPILAGLIRNNPAWVFQGAINSALLALLLNSLLLRLELKLISPGLKGTHSHAA